MLSLSLKAGKWAKEVQTVERELTQVCRRWLYRLWHHTLHHCWQSPLLCEEGCAREGEERIVQQLDRPAAIQGIAITTRL